jgi:hypothetical protein
VSTERSNARDGALAKLAEEAARFAHGPDRPTRPVVVADTRMPAVAPPTVRTPRRAHPNPPGYVPVAVAPERGNTRPALPVDGRLHMRVAQPTLDALDDIMRMWKAADPAGLRDLERATLVRVGLAMVLQDVAMNGADGAVGEAVRAALEPAVRHTTGPLPALARWIRPAPAGVAPTAWAATAGQPVGEASA